MEIFTMEGSNHPFNNGDEMMHSIQSNVKGLTQAEVDKALRYRFTAQSRLALRYAMLFPALPDKAEFDNLLGGQCLPDNEFLYPVTLHLFYRNHKSTHSYLFLLIGDTTDLVENIAGKGIIFF